MGDIKQLGPKNVIIQIFQSCCEQIARLGQSTTCFTQSCSSLEENIYPKQYFSIFTLHNDQDNVFLSQLVFYHPQFSCIFPMSLGVAMVSVFRTRTSTHVGTLCPKSRTQISVTKKSYPRIPSAFTTINSCLNVFPEISISAITNNHYICKSAPSTSKVASQLGSFSGSGRLPCLTRQTPVIQMPLCLIGMTPCY